jgi:hypothetical protein
MKTIVLVAVVFLFYGPAASPAADSYPVAVHVSASENPESGRTVLDVTLDGKKYELTSLFKQDGLLIPGDYKAKLFASDTKKSYEVNQLYELLLPDGKTAKYAVSGVSE